MTHQQQRILLAIFGILCWLLIAFAYFYLENTLYLDPCPLCMMQRLAFAIIGTIFILDAILWPSSIIGITIMKVLKYLAVFFGIGLAARHLYIQTLPAEEVPSCGLDFYGLMEQNSVFSGLWQAMQGSGNCATKDMWFGLTIPTWAMAGFVIMLFVVFITQRPKPVM